MIAPAHQKFVSSSSPYFLRQENLHAVVERSQPTTGKGNIEM
jgi:hypothetical protein